MRLIKTTARILKLKTKHSFKAIGEEITLDNIKSAIHFWCLSCQDTITNDLKRGVEGKGPFKCLNLVKQGDIYIVKGRTDLWNELSYNEDIIILPNKHHFSRLYAEYVHNQNHLGVHACVAKVRTKFWIPGIVQMMKSIRFKCVVCRRQYGKLSSQIMASLPEERLKPTPPWLSTALDLFGPLPIRGEIN